MFRGLLFFLREGWKYDKRYVLWLFIRQMIAATLPVAGALLPKVLIDELMLDARIGALAAAVLGFAIYFLAANALTEFLYWDEFSRRLRVSGAFHLKLYEQLVYADYAGMDSPEMHRMRARAEKFLYCNYHGFGYLLSCAVNIAGQVLTLLGLIAVLSVLDAWLVALFAAMTLLCSAVESRAAKKALEKQMQAAETERVTSYYSTLFQSADYAKEIRLNRAQEWLLGRWKQDNAHSIACYAASNGQYIRSGAARAGFGFVQQVTAYSVLLHKVLYSGMSVGTLTMCIGAVNAFSEALRSLLQSLNEIRAYDAYYDDLDAFLNRPAQMRKNARLPVGEKTHRIEFVHVSFRYPDAESWALEDISLVLEPGQHLALVGENGSGKSTLIKLLCRLYDPTVGCIRMDGVDIRELDYDAYLAQFAAVFQDFQLFDLPLRDNLAFGRELHDEELMHVLRHVGLEERIRTLPHGLDTHVGRLFSEEGFEPSGGEAQKLALARALLRDAPILILDEPAAALDAQSESELYQQFDALVRSKSAIYISHRMSSCRFCDRIAVLDNGHLTEEGTHEELMKQKGKYAHLYNLQAHYYTD